MPFGGGSGLRPGALSGSLGAWVKVQQPLLPPSHLLGSRLTILTSCPPSPLVRITALSRSRSSPSLPQGQSVPSRSVVQGPHVAEPPDNMEALDMMHESIQASAQPLETLKVCLLEAHKGPPSYTP